MQTKLRFARTDKLSWTNTAKPQNPISENSNQFVKLILLSWNVRIIIIIIADCPVPEIKGSENTTSRQLQYDFKHILYYYSTHAYKWGNGLKTKSSQTRNATNCTKGGILNLITTITHPVRNEAEFADKRVLNGFSNEHFFIQIKITNKNFFNAQSRLGLTKSYI